MKKLFDLSQGRTNETLELQIEEKWIHAHYIRGDFKKTAYILKNEEKTILEFLAEFLNECQVSDELSDKINNQLSPNKKIENTNTQHWQQFSIFLIKTLSINVVIGITLAAALFGGFKGGERADMHFGLYPLFTISGVLLGLLIGGLICFVIIYNYLSDNKRDDKLFPLTKEQNKIPAKDYPVIDVTQEEVREAVRKFSEDLPKGVYRTILVNEDYSIDFQQLAFILGGTPSKKYYMSKETYDIFDESEKEIPVLMDMVQKAVDHYVEDHQKYPMLQYDPLRRVNYYELTQKHYLKSVPEIEFYITDYDGIISNVKPKKKRRIE